MRKHAKKKSHVHVNSFLKAQKSFLCACKSLYFYFFILRALYVVTLRKFMKKLRKYKYLQMTVLYTKYKAENNVV